MLRFAGLAVAFALWAAITYSGMVDNKFLPNPTQFVQHLWSIAVSGYGGRPLWEHVLMSMWRALAGFFLGALVGVPAGLLIGYYKRAGDALDMLFALLRPIPPIAYIPLVALYLGLGEVAKVALIFWAVFLFVTLNVQVGVGSVRQVLLRAGENIGLNSFQLFKHVIFPSVLPNIMAALRTGLSVAWALVVAAELLAAQSGLGYMIQDAATFFHLDTVFVGILLIGLVGLTLDSLLTAAHRRILHWEGKQ